MAGTVGFVTAVGVHPVIGYLSASHLAPAVIVSAVFATGISLCYGPMMQGGDKTEPHPVAAANHTAS